jgi:hypothetical protein
MAQASTNVIEALDRIAGQLQCAPGLRDLRVRPHERVLLLSINGHRTLHGAAHPPRKDALYYYHLTGTFTELTGAIHGTGQVESVLSWFPSEVQTIVIEFPDAALFGNPPFDRPPKDGYRKSKPKDLKPADTLGHTKSLFRFEDGSTLVGFGVNQTKLAPYPDHSAELWETNTEVIVTGTKEFQGAKGLITSDMGAYFNPLVLPLDPTVEPYKSGFPVKVFACIRLIVQ